MKREEIIFHTLIVLSVFGTIIGKNPACCALLVLLFFSHKIADKYFHDTFYDENRKTLSQLKADFSKIKAKQDVADMKNAFGAKNG